MEITTPGSYRRALVTGAGGFTTQAEGMGDTPLPVLRRLTSLSTESPYQDHLDISVIIPAFNEEHTIGPLLSRTEKTLALPGLRFEIIVVDDGSTDSTRTKAVTFARENGGTVHVLARDTNEGKGAAVCAGAKASRGEIVVVLDADLEYAPEDVLRLIAPIAQGSADIVFGSRFVGKADGMPVSHWIGNRVLTETTNLLYRARLTDVMTGDKAMSRRALQRLNVSQIGFGFEVEVAAKALKLGLRIREIPIRYRRRSAGVSKIKWRDGIRSWLHLIELKSSEPRP